METQAVRTGLAVDAGAEKMLLQKCYWSYVESKYAISLALAALVYEILNIAFCG